MSTATTAPFPKRSASAQLSAISSNSSLNSTWPSRFTVRTCLISVAGTAGVPSNTRDSGQSTLRGVEIPGQHVGLSAQYAQSLGVENVSFFSAPDPTRIPLPDASIDFVVSYDVLEHVHSPPASVQELSRVLRPGGKAFPVFPVYPGARSHHLDYLTTLPGLHWVFSAECLVRAANGILAKHTEFGVPEQPTPKRCFDGSRKVLPGLNGLSGRHLGALFTDFRVLQRRRHVLLRRRPLVGNAITHFAQHAPSWLADAVTSNISCVLLKPKFE